MQCLCWSISNNFITLLNIKSVKSIKCCKTCRLFLWSVHATNLLKITIVWKARKRGWIYQHTYFYVADIFKYWHVGKAEISLKAKRELPGKQNHGRLQTPPLAVVMHKVKTHWQSQSDTCTICGHTFSCLVYLAASGCWELSFYEIPWC